jgi:hypothetical protein
MSDIDICKAGVTTCHVCGGDGVCEDDDLCKTISLKVCNFVYNSPHTANDKMRCMQLLDKCISKRYDRIMD